MAETQTPQDGVFSAKIMSLVKFYLHDPRAEVETGEYGIHDLYGSQYEISHDEALEYMDNIELALRRDRDHMDAVKGLAEYVPDSIKDIVLKVTPDIQTIGGHLWCVADIKLTRSITPGEMGELSSWWQGQLSDGWGEGFEQRTIRIGHKELYAVPWWPESDFTIESEQELSARLGLSAPPSINYIGGSEILPPPLSRDDEERAINALSAGDDQAKKLLIEHNLRLVVYISRRFENTGVGLEDLISIGTIGLIKAINTFNAEKKIKLATYASRCVENEILMHLRKISSHKSEVSLDEPLNTDWDGNELLLSDVLGTDGDEISRPMEDDADKRMLMDAVYSLGERERMIIVMRFGLNGSSEYTQKEVADIMGISQSYISRLEKRIISRLKREIIRQSY